jgi:hypothetical protein
MHEGPEIQPLSVASLICDPEVQRSLDVRRVNKIAAELNPDALGTITVSHRSNGTYHIIDGQHRVGAVRLALGDDEKVTCRVFAGLSLEEEAGMFRLLNNTAKPQALDIFRVRVIEGEATAVGIAQMLERQGWQVSVAGRDGNFAAVTAIERIYRSEPDAAERAVSTATRAWGHANAAGDGRIVEAIGSVYLRYGAAVDPADMVERLARFPGGPGGLLGKGRGLKEMIGGTITSAIAEVAVETYNRARRTRALPPWRST